eukprot:CAMPEP_0183437666 /NCGR_PEP_ID=MMETSP0370-20130417/74127_1 /TAXON_ID=268820 /ORGANISM="Peridinium aciculiferum, Strain PAER-2" /LENGTH=92 /DNA_ID=CAMNT_0025625559 /DNA_START=869 /DNA_END=1147 /DNA_ORIENTATION=-
MTLSQIKDGITEAWLHVRTAEFSVTIDTSKPATKPGGDSLEEKHAPRLGRTLSSPFPEGAGSLTRWRSSNGCDGGGGISRGLSPTDAVSLMS